MPPPRTVLLSETAYTRSDGSVGGICNIRCGRCARQTSCRAFAAEAPAILRQRGWLVADEPYGHRCPSCNNAAALAALPSPSKGPKPMTDPAAPAARTASADQKRKIREALDARYDEDKGGYRENWSDKALAATLDVPAVFVRDLREAMGLGPDRNESHQQFAAELALARQDLEAAAKAVATANERAMAAEARLKRLELGAAYEPKVVAA